MLNVIVATATINDILCTVWERARMTNDGQLVISYELRGRKKINKDVFASGDIIEIDAANNEIRKTVLALCDVPSISDVLTRDFCGCEVKPNGRSVAHDCFNYFAGLAVRPDTKGWQMWDDLMVLH